MWEKVPQLEPQHLACHDLRRPRRHDRAVHSGFASPASGDFHADQQKDFTPRIEQLLAEKAPANVRVSSAGGDAATKTLD